MKLNTDKFFQDGASRSMARVITALVEKDSSNFDILSHHVRTEHVPKEVGD